MSSSSLPWAVPAFPVLPALSLLKTWRQVALVLSGDVDAWGPVCLGALMSPEDWAALGGVAQDSAWLCRPPAAGRCTFSDPPLCCSNPSLWPLFPSPTPNHRFVLGICSVSLSLFLVCKLDAVKCSSQEE